MTGPRIAVDAYAEAGFNSYRSFIATVLAGISLDG
jgi:hypothetical protein